MKNLILLFLTMGFITVSAQRQSKSRYRLGYKIGMVNVQITGGRVKSPSKIALIGGLWCQVKLSKNWTAQAEVIYVEKGTGGFTKNRAPRVGEYAVAIMYLEVPILFQYHKKKFTFEFGPGLGALTYRFENLYGSPTPNLIDSYPFTTKEFSFNVGCGYALNEKWYLGLRYTHSLLPVRKQIPDISKQVYNRVIAITVARYVKFKKQKTRETKLSE